MLLYYKYFLTYYTLSFTIVCKAVEMTQLLRLCRLKMVVIQQNGLYDILCYLTMVLVLTHAY